MLTYKEFSEKLEEWCNDEKQVKLLDLENDVVMHSDKIYGFYNKERKPQIEFYPKKALYSLYEEGKFEFMEEEQNFYVCERFIGFIQSDFCDSISVWQYIPASEQERVEKYNDLSYSPFQTKFEAESYAERKNVKMLMIIEQEYEKVCKQRNEIVGKLSYINKTVDKFSEIRKVFNEKQ